MFLSEFNFYLVTCGEGNDLRTLKVSGEDLKTVFATFPRVVCIEEIHTFEIYVKNQEGVRGWDIKFIQSTDKLIKTYPLFDCIISKNDHVPADLSEHLTYEGADYPHGGVFLPNTEKSENGKFYLS